MEQLGSQWTDYHEMWYFCIFHKCIDKIQVSLQSDKIIGYFLLRPIHIYGLFRSVLLRIKYGSDERFGENRNTLLRFSLGIYLL
jgi:hypothetical protein